METQRSDAKARIGYLPENCPIYPEMTVADFLDYTAALHGVAAARRMQAVRDAIFATKLSEKVADPIANLSRGQPKRSTSDDSKTASYQGGAWPGDLDSNQD